MCVGRSDRHLVHVCFGGLVSKRITLIRRTCLALSVLSFLNPASRLWGQQSYTFTKVLDGATQRPDNLGTFNLAIGSATPAFDGRYLVFRDPGPLNDGGSHAAIWSFDTQGKTLRKLIDFQTRVPGANATFNDIQIRDTAPLVNRGSVVFVARDTSTGPYNQGLYTVPASGGAIVKLADYATADPSGGTFTVFDSYARQAGAFSFDGATVAFNANGSSLTVGNYLVKPDGSALHVIADNLQPYAGQGGAVNVFSTPIVSGNNVVMLGSDGTDPAAGYSGLYLAPVNGNGAGLTELFHSLQALPDNPATAFHTRFDAPAIAMDGTLLAFRADDSAHSPGNFGLYAIDVPARTITRIADSNTSLPGLAKLNAIANLGVAVSQGSVLFKASDTNGGMALYLWRSGSITRVIGKGDRVDGQTVEDLEEPGPGALRGQDLAFTSTFAGVSGRALYLASAASPAGSRLVSVGNAASYAASSLAPGEVVTVFGTGIGPPALVRAAFDASNRLATILSGTRILVNGVAAPLLYVSEKADSAIIPFGVGENGPATIQVEYNGTTSNSITVPLTPTMPGVFSADLSGSGPGAITYPDGSSNSPDNPAAPGSAVVLWMSGLGPIDPAPADGAIVSASALRYPASVTIAGVPATILYQGPAPAAIAGLYQINCLVPEKIVPGNADVVVTIAGRQSQPNLTVAVK